MRWAKTQFFIIKAIEEWYASCIPEYRDRQKGVSASKRHPNYAQRRLVESQAINPGLPYPHNSRHVNIE